LLEKRNLHQREKAMDNDLRRSGIEAVGKIPWGTHLCQFYETSQDLMETIVPYFQEGLAAGELCVWIASAPLQVDQATAVLRAAIPDLDKYINRGQMEILDFSQWCIRSGRFSPDEALQSWAIKLDAALKQGYEGLRLTVNTFLLEKVDWDDFSVYEREMNSIIGRHRMLAICTYPLEKFNALNILDVFAGHQFALVKRSGRWEIIKGDSHSRQNIVLNSINRIYEIGAQCKTLEDLGKACLDIIESVIDSKFGFIGEIDQDGLLHVLASSDHSFGIRGLFGKVIQDGKTLLANDPKSYTDSVGMPDGHPPLTAFLGVPFIYEGTVTGMIGVANGEGGYRSEDRETLEELTPTILKMIMRKRADLAREHSDALRGILDAVKESIWLSDAEGKILMGNLTAMRRIGKPPQEVIGKHFGMLMDPELAGPRMERLKRVVESGQPIQFEDERGGIQFLHSFYPVKDEDGRIYQVAAFSSDITERKQSEENLREMRDYLENLIDYANAPIIVWDPSYRITRFNHAFERLTGLRASEAISRPLDVLFPEGSKGESLAHIKRTLSGERWEVVEIPILSKTGQTRTVLWNSANIYSKDGSTIIATIAQGQDITDRKQAEAELRESKEELSRSKDDLELKVQERTIQLLRAKEAAEAAAQAKSDFMANMSHEIRTPMNAVIGMTSLLLVDENLTPEQKDFIETIRMSGDALMVIINDILDFSRMQKERAELEEQPFGLRSCVEESIDQISSRASEKNLNLAYVIDRDVPENIIGDPNRLRQILINLLSNAVKFTRRGEIKLTISGRRLDSGYEMHFAIQDTGIGISSDKMDRLFQPFSQVDASITRDYGGTGLGLAIAKKLIELMGGRIWVESELGRGSIFHFTIVAGIVVEPEKTLQEVLPQLAGKNVLIVDNNKANRRILGEYAYCWGMAPLIAASSQDALNWLRRGNIFDVAILDADLPETDGLALAEEIRKIDKNMPLILQTSIGHHIDSDIPDAYLAKPIKPSQMHEVLVSLLTRRSAQARGIEKVQISSMHILLAEDNVSSQKVVRQMLKRLDCTVDVVANGIEALQALQRQPYDLVLMDVRMPEMDGLEATRLIRRRWPEDGPKVIAITAYALEGDREKCLAAGMNDYISKPVKMEELAAILKKFAEPSGEG
jgi:PAS domain S-box-containing protein